MNVHRRTGCGGGGGGREGDGRRIIGGAGGGDRDAAALEERLGECDVRVHADLDGLLTGEEAERVFVGTAGDGDFVVRRRRVGVRRVVHRARHRVAARPAAALGERRRLLRAGRATSVSAFFGARDGALEAAVAAARRGPTDDVGPRLAKEKGLKGVYREKGLNVKFSVGWCQVSSLGEESHFSSVRAPCRRNDFLKHE